MLLKKLFAAVISFCLVTFSASALEIKLGHVGEPGSLFNDSAEHFVKLANSKLGSKAKVVNFGSSQLGSDKEMMQKVKLGTLEMAIPSTFMSTVHDEFGVFEMPYIIKDRNHMSKVEKEILLDPVIANQKKQFDASLATLPTITTGGYTYSQKEILRFLNKKELFTRSTTTGKMRREDLFYDSLDAKEKVLYSAQLNKNAVIPFPASLFVKKDSENERVKNIMYQYASIEQAQLNFANVFENKKNTKLAEISGKYIPVVTNINVSNKDGATSRNTWEGIVGTVLLRYSMPGGTKGGAEGTDIKTAREWLNSKDKDDIQYKKLIQGDKTFIIMMKGTEEAIIPLIPLEANQLPKYSNEPSTIQKQVISAQYMNNGNTSISSDPTLAMFSRNKFVNVKNLNVTADLQWNESNNAINYINLNLKLPSGWKSLELSAPVDVDGATEFIYKANDNYIKNLYLSDTRVPESIKNEIRNLK